MTFEVSRTVLVVIATFIISAVLGAFVMRTSLMHNEQKQCFDSLYVYPPLVGDDESSAGGLPAKRLTFSCPHPDQKLELVGSGGLTCTCNPFMKRP